MACRIPIAAVKYNARALAFAAPSAPATNRQPAVTQI
jgi:hypothetical protein